MKILAIEKDLGNIDWSIHTDVLKSEAEFVYKLYLEGIIREIYFNDCKNAVIIIECDSIELAKTILNSFPLVKNGLISFEIAPLNPYSGLRRLMNQKTDL